MGYFTHTSKLSDDFVKSCPKVGIPFTPDFNAGLGTTGVSRVSVPSNFDRVFT